MTLRILTSSRLKTCCNPLPKGLGGPVVTELLARLHPSNNSSNRYYPIGFAIRSFASDDSPDDKPSDPNAWRKQQLENLQKKFTTENTIESEEDLQPMWKEMEGRVTRRRPRTLADTSGKTGRVNIKNTDEEVWLEEGMYNSDDGDGKKKDGK